MISTSKNWLETRQAVESFYKAKTDSNEKVMVISHSTATQVEKGNFEEAVLMLQRKSAFSNEAIELGKRYHCSIESFIRDNKRFPSFFNIDEEPIIEELEKRFLISMSSYITDKEDWLYFTGKVDATTDLKIIDWKTTGSKFFKWEWYMNSHQLPLYSLYFDRPEMTIGLINRHDGNFATKSQLITDDMVSDAIDWLVDMARRLKNYCIENDKVWWISDIGDLEWSDEKS